MAVTNPAPGDLIVPDPQNLLLNPLIFRGVQSGSALQTLTTATVTAVAIDAESDDPYGGHDNATNNSRYTIPVALNGYRFTFRGAVLYAANATGGRCCGFRINGTVIPVDGFVTVGNPTASFNALVQAEYSAVVSSGDYWELVADQNSGGNLATVAGSRLSIYFGGLT